MTSSLPEPSLDQLPAFDARAFQPPEWAHGPAFQWGKDEHPAETSESGRRAAAEREKDGQNGVASSLSASGGGQKANGAGDKDKKIVEMLEKLGAGLKGIEGEGSESDENSDEEWEDASEGETSNRENGDDDGAAANYAKFTTAELRTLLETATELKNKGNKAFTASPSDPEQALVFYNEAIDYLPSIPREPPKPLESTSQPKEPKGSGIEEVTDEEASAIEAAKTQEEQVDAQNEGNANVDERNEVEDGIRDCQKAVWGNIGACYVSLQNDKEGVKACDKALEIDPQYIKALQRRAAANERLSTWTSLTSAQTDYQTLLTLLPTSSPLRPKVSSSLKSLPAKIAVQQEKEKDEMLSKLKELGNGLLGKFGLSTDMFKFEQQPGGGYGMKFER